MVCKSSCYPVLEELSGKVSLMKLFVFCLEQKSMPHSDCVEKSQAEDHHQNKTKYVKLKMEDLIHG